MSMDQVAREMGLKMVDQHMGVGNKLQSGTDPDAVGAKNKVFFLRYSFPIAAPIGSEEEFVTVPEKVLEMPRWRANEMALNREGKLVTEEEAQPFLIQQKKEADILSAAARLEAERFLNDMKERNGEPIEDPEITALKAQNEELSAKMDQLMAMIKGGK